mgnify:CR=1 FL=1
MATGPSSAIHSQSQALCTAAAVPQGHTSAWYHTAIVAAPPPFLPGRAFDSCFYIKHQCLPVRTTTPSTTSASDTRRATSTHKPLVWHTTTQRRSGLHTRHLSAPSRLEQDRPRQGLHWAPLPSNIPKTLPSTTHKLAWRSLP